MAKNDREIDRLRAHARKLERNAGNKISRLRTVKGVDVAGTRHDPRRGQERVARYNAPQLRAHIARLEGFQSRSTQFLPDAHGKPIHIRDWAPIEKAQDAFHRMERAVFERMKDVFIPESGMTVGERDAMRTVDHPRAGRHRSAGHPAKLSSKSVVSAKALRKLTQDYKRRANPEHFERRRRNWRRGAKKMLDELGLKDLWADLKELTDDQFDLLWNYTSFPEKLKLPYQLRRALLAAKDYATSITENHSEGLKGMVAWARNTNIPD